jgi:hypothetical protein
MTTAKSSRPSPSTRLWISHDSVNNEKEELDVRENSSRVPAIPFAAGFGHTSIKVRSGSVSSLSLAGPNQFFNA